MLDNQLPTFWDVLFAIAPYVVSFLVGLGTLIVFLFSKQRRLNKFLGVDKKAKRVIVYLSSLFIPPGCSVGFDGLTRSYQGIVIPTEELSISAKLEKALMIEPFEYVPPKIRKSVEEKIPLLKSLAVAIKASPLQERDIDFSTRSLITVGSQGYNVVTHYCNDHNLTQLQICNDGTAIQIMRGKDKGEVIWPPTNHHDIAILERITEGAENATTIFVAAGLGSVGTMGSVQYLIDNWQQLQKKHSEREFALVLQFGPVERLSPEGLLKGTVIREIP